jgi:glyoxylase-like metal-dependent hydrolase (beta-lactamase superfamily II)/8-oxo-dGTP pyrophosphatase MutT (NUDIX family)
LGTITQASSVLLARAPAAAEVFLVARALALRFMGGFVAFPGGKAHASDDGLARPEDGLSAPQVTAARELFEEVGVLLARTPSGDLPPAGPEFASSRRDLVEEKTTFADVLARSGLHLEGRDFRAAGRLVTPPFAPVRFDTSFFVADLPPGQHAEVWPGELTGGEFLTAEAALARWQEGSYPLSPPTVSILELMRGRPVAELPERLRPGLEQLDAGRLPAIWFSPGVLMIPLDCQGLPPTTHTNAFLVGSGPAYLIDPGPADPAEQEKLFDAVDGRRVDAVVLTHHHPDHVGAARMCAARYGVKVLAHPVTAELLQGQVRVDGFLHDGDRLDLGAAPHGRGGWALEALHTPGHAPGHLAFYEPSYQLLFAADMVSTLSSVIITPQDGDLRQYVASLRRLQELPCRMLLPAHGPPTLRAGRLLAEAVAHRASRERQLRDALAAGPREVGELVGELYRGFPAAVLKLAALQTEAGLIKLREDGVACNDGAVWSLRG